MTTQPNQTCASAPGKIILCGEHAVVYGRAAIALPLSDVRAYATVSPDRARRGVSFEAPNLGRSWLAAHSPSEPLSKLAAEIVMACGAPSTSSFHMAINSDIPIASGMGSGAAVATALVRALSQYLGCNFDDARVSELVYANERRLHGTPSGIDNTVVAFERPIWFERTADDRRPTTDDNQPFAASLYRPAAPSPNLSFLPIARPLMLLIADTGVRSATKLPVAEVRRRWLAAQPRYEALFDQIGALVYDARAALASGDIAALGPLLDLNHALLREIGVSSPELDHLVDVAKLSGALGAKLSGAGWGGVMIALVTPETEERVLEALHVAGAANFLATTVSACSV